MAELTITTEDRECADCGWPILAYTECIRVGDEALCADAPAVRYTAVSA